MQERISIDPNVQHGRPVIRGTRVTVARIVGSLAGGMSSSEVQQEYDITAEDVQAALQFATDLIEHEQFHPLPTS